MSQAEWERKLNSASLGCARDLILLFERKKMGLLWSLSQHFCRALEQGVFGKLGKGILG